MSTPASPVAQTINTIVPEAHAVEPVSGWIEVFGISLNFSVIFFICLVGVGVFYLWKAQRDENENTFNVWDFFQSRNQNGTRSTSIVKSTYAASFLLSSWVVFDQQIKNSLSSEIFGLWLTAWVAPLVTKLIKGDTAIIPSLPEVK